MTMKNDAKFEEEFSCHFKTETRNLNKFWSEHLKVSKIFILMCSFWAKYIFFHLKKYRGLIFYETEEGYRIWKGIDLSFQNWQKEFDKFWPGHLKVPNIFTLIGSFWAKYILFGLKKYRGVISLETEEGYNIWRGIDWSFQNWHKEFDELWPEHSKVSKIFTLMVSFWANYIFFEIKKSTEELPFITLKSDTKFEEKMTCRLENDMRNLANFHQGFWNCQTWNFHGILLSNVENVWA